MNKKTIIGIIARLNITQECDKVLCVEEHYRKTVINKEVYQY